MHTSQLIIIGKIRFVSSLVDLLAQKQKTLSIFTPNPLHLCP